MNRQLLFGLLSLTRSAPSAASLYKILPRLLVVVVLGIAAGLMLAVFLVALLIGLYHTLAYHGWDSLDALWLTIASTLVLLLVLICAIKRSLHALKPTGFSPLNYIEDVAQSFLDGLKNSKKD